MVFSEHSPCRAHPNPGHARWVQLKIRYHHPSDAFWSSFFPGVSLANDVTIEFETQDWFESYVCFNLSNNRKPFRKRVDAQTHHLDIMHT
jgi:hypothetical protein